MDETEIAPRRAWLPEFRAEGMHWLRRAVDIVLPPACIACSEPVAETGALCASCWSRLRLLERPFCARLALPFAYDIGEGALSAEAIADPPPFQRLRAVAVYDALSGRIVQGLKYHDRTDIAKSVGTMMARVASEFVGAVDVVVPIPLHRRRLWQRRFNQSALLAEAVAAGLALPHEPQCLLRIRATRQQVGLKAAARADNVRGALAVAPGARPAIAGRRILLVDDVYTTGATVKAATRALLRGGAASVEVVVFARVVEGTD
jgi:ComF family protein